ncbi:MAG: lipopolysaccharide assembly protein LapB [Tolumonas sp.]|nr:lipopolysaccharide assembly protein LapB [Tolumonas sp.]
MLELLFLLLPVAVAYGWYMGRRSVRIDEERKSSQRSRNYAAGINFLLSEQPDKAVDLFIDLLQVDTDTIDTHLALGNLFRQRGEVDRAIRIHQNLVARCLDSTEQQNLSMLELARDFVAAGLLDRAENVLHSLLKDDELADDARKMLLQIYEQLNEWQKAIDIAEKISGKNHQRVVAHYYCQLAESDLLLQDFKSASSRLKRALKTDQQCVRALILFAQVYIKLQQYDAAIKHIDQIPELSSAFASEAWKLLQQCKSHIDTCDLGSILVRWLEHTQNTTVALALADSIQAGQGVAEAENFILRHIKRNPTMKGFHRLMTYQLEAMHDEKAAESITLLRSLVEKQIAVKPIYRCEHCGFSSKVIFWHCPSCKQWGSISPIQGLDGD